MHVHFILTAGDLNPCYRRAIRSARVHGLPIVLWHAGERPDLTGLEVEPRQIEIPPWLSSKKQAHIFDVLGYKIGAEHGGMVLGLDTISLRPALDLLGDSDVVVSTDWPEQDQIAFPNRYNNNFIARPNSMGAQILYVESVRRVMNEPEEWGYTGPILLTDFVKRGRVQAAPYPALCGWAPGYIWRFYLGLERPHPETRVIHLCRTAYIDLEEGRYDEWGEKYPYYAGVAKRRTNLNADLFAI